MNAPVYLASCSSNSDLRTYQGMCAGMQSVLEMLFDKVQAQSDAIAALSKHSAARFGDRLALLEARFDEMFGPPGTESALNPFRQQEMAARVSQLEAAQIAAADEVAELRHVAEQVRLHCVLIEH